MRDIVLYAANGDTYSIDEVEDDHVESRVVRLESPSGGYINARYKGRDVRLNLAHVIAIFVSPSYELEV